MTAPTLLRRLSQQERINFLLTNRIPRQLLTIFMGWLSRIENRTLARALIWLWRRFSDLDLSEARSTDFSSLQACFTRALKEGARPIDQNPRCLVSPCDAIVGACGEIQEDLVLQAKGFPYPLIELLEDPELVRYYRGGQYATLRLTSSMYHRFHAPGECLIEQVRYISGDTWNVNPIALKRIERLFCRNERAIIRCRLVPSGQLLTLVPVAAVLVASIRLHFLDVLLHLRYRGADLIRCDAKLTRGEEMGWFEHGSTIIVLSPRGTRLCASEGRRIHMGEALLELL